jgi:hypothetical protein
MLVLQKKKRKMRKMFRPKENEVTDGENYVTVNLNVCILRLIITGMGDIRNSYALSVAGPQERDHLGNRNVDGRVILKCILKK